MQDAVLTRKGTASTRRAPSSPRHACGLNVSLFLRPCSSVQPAQYGGPWMSSRWVKCLRIPAKALPFLKMLGLAIQPETQGVKPKRVILVMSLSA